MKFCLLAISICLIFTNLAEAKELKAKASWKTFRSDYGYEFKYPDCWSVSIDDPDYDGPVEKSQSIILKQGEKCSDKSFQSEGGGISFLIHDNFESKEKSIAAITEKENWFKNISKTNYRLAMKDHRSENSYVYFEAEDPYINSNLSREVRWRMSLFCSQFEIIGLGPELRSPDPSYFGKFKKGDLGLPEPEKTIYESIRCIKPKIKSKSKK